MTASTRPATFIDAVIWSCAASVPVTTMVSARLPSTDEPSRTLFAVRGSASGGVAAAAVDVSVERHELTSNAKLNTKRMKTTRLFMQTPNDSINGGYRTEIAIRREVARGPCG